MNCSIKVEGVMYGIKIKKKNKGLLNSVTATPKAAVCPNCGCIVMYIEEYKSYAN